MRAREFTINVPITITINDDGSGVDVSTTPDDDQEDTMVPPLQQSLELQKAQAGKSSTVISQLTKSEEQADEDYRDTFGE